MIFLTVGTELPFNRLVKAVDNWSARNSKYDVFGQIGNVGKDDYLPQHFEWKKFVTIDEYNHRYKEASLIIAHAGMGSIITALVTAKPLLIMPRRAEFLEHRNDHQIATAAKFKDRNGIIIAEKETLIEEILDRWLTLPGSMVEGGVGLYAEGRLIETIRNFIHKTKKL